MKHLSINALTRRRQLYILGGVSALAAAIAAAVMMYGDERSAAQKAPATPVPNMAGVVTAAFDERVQQSALAQQQAKTSALESQMTTLQQQFAQSKLDFDNKLRQKDEDIERLKQAPPGTAGSNTTNGQQTPPAAPNGTPLPGPVATGPARPPQYSVNPANTSSAIGVNGQGAGFYPQGSGQRMTGGVTTTRFNYDQLKKKPTTLPWISSGSFSDAIMIEGADANASVTGQQNTQPVTLRLQGKIQMPNNKEFDTDGCFVTGEIWGDISSERGVIRTHNISCNLKNGKDVDMEMKGHVSYMGKGGVKGTPVMRNGMIVGYAGAAGFLSGIGEGVKSAATPSVGLGATANASAGDVLSQGMGGGANKAAETLSQYFIKRAEQYHPIIDIGAGNRVTVVFQEGFQLETRQDSEARKLEQTAQNAGEQVQKAVAPQQQSSQASTSTTALGNINPDDVLRQASQLRLGDTIN